MSSEEDERKEDASLYFVLFSALLAAVIILSRVLHEFPRLNSVFSEASMILVVGMIAGYFAHNVIQHRDDDPYVNGNDELQEEVYRVAINLLSFSPNVFFMALLPPILFNSGYHLRRELFYRHIKPIAMFACLGTFISALCTGFSLYGIQQLGWMGDFEPKLLELMTFGSLIAATDTVSVLAIFQKKKVDPHLFYLVFGESALNDAVALVLFKTFARILEDAGDGSEAYVKSGWMFVGDVLVEGIGSPVTGILFGFATALIFKHMDFREHPTLELPLYLVLLLYVPFIIAEGFHLSGIVTIFFCGISARRYVTPNVSETTAKGAAAIFKVCAYLAETAIFLELGMSVFGLTGSFKWKFIAWAFIMAILGRAVSIYPLAIIYNMTLGVRIKDLPPEEQPPPPEEEAYTPPRVDQTDVLNTSNTDASSADSAMISIKSAINSLSSGTNNASQNKRQIPVKRQDKHISTNMMHVLWFAGLRGAVAYACVRDFPNVYGHNDEFIAATVVVVFGTIIGMGGTVESLLKLLDIDMNINEDDYMEDWYKHIQLKGTFHYFEHYYIYSCVAMNEAVQLERATSMDPDDKKNIEMQEAFAYRKRRAPPNSLYSFT